MGILNRDEGRFVWLRKIRGRLITRPRSGPPRIEADGRDDWVGWLELKTGPVDETAFQNTARVIAEANVDVLALVEVESRPVMLEFHDYIYQPVTADQYGPMMLIDGNDSRGIDVGLMLRPGYRIASMLSHVDDRMPDGQPIFSRDCPEYTVELPNGARIVVLPNHFKSKYGGNDPRSRAKRRAQAEAVAGYYRRLRLIGPALRRHPRRSERHARQRGARPPLRHRPARGLRPPRLHRVPVRLEPGRARHRDLPDRLRRPQDRLHLPVARPLGPRHARRHGPQGRLDRVAADGTCSTPSPGPITRHPITT